MKEITSPARRKWSFPSPVDVHCERSDEQKDENDERPATLQSTKLWPRLPAHKSYCGAIAVDRPRKMYFWIFPVAVLGSSLTKVTLCGALKRARLVPTGPSFPFPWSLIPFTRRSCLPPKSCSRCN